MACVICGSSICTCQQQAEGLIPDLTCVADCVRALKAELGARPYDVFLVWMRWTGGERGVGESYVLEQLQIHPTPNVEGLASLRQDNIPIGSEEIGTLKITEISPRYDENMLGSGYLHGKPMGEDTDFFWEIVIQSGAQTIRRRFHPVSVPTLEPTKFQWVISLVRAGSDRTGDGRSND